MFEKILKQLGLEPTAENIAMIKAEFDSETQGLINKNNELINKNKKFKKYEDLDIEKLMEQQQNNEVNEYLEHIKKGQGAEYLASIRASERNAVEKEFQESIAAKDLSITEWQNQFNGLQSQNDQSMIREHLRTELSKVKGINKSYIDTIIRFATDEMEVEEVEGVRSAAYKGRNIKGTDGQAKTINNWFQDKSSDPAFGFFLENMGGTGGAGGQGGQQSGELEEQSGDDILGELGL